MTHLFSSTEMILEAAELELCQTESISDVLLNYKENSNSEIENEKDIKNEINDLESPSN